MSSKTTSDAVASARDALERHAWNEAFQLFKEADAASPLDSEDLERLAEAAWWAAEPDESLAARERAFSAYEQLGDTRKAGLMALELMSEHARRRAPSIAEGWARRAERLLGDDTESPEYGYLILKRARVASHNADPDEAATLARQAVEVGAKHGDKDLQAHALMEEGMSLVARGDVTEGLALVDEATMAAVSGELSPWSTGVVYCNTISTCANLADYRRAGEWTEAAHRWCERQAISGFPGICRVHRAEIIRLRGNWLEAEEEATKACKELNRFGLPDQASGGFYEIGEIRLRMGDMTAAAEAFEQAHELGHSGQPGTALLQLAQGKADAAHASITRVLEEEREPLSRARLLPVALEIALARQDIETATFAADELEQIAEKFGSTALQAVALGARAAVQVAGGDAQSAVRNARESWRKWQEVEAPYEAARARLLMGEAFIGSGDPEAGRMEIKAARSVFEKLGAALDSRRAAELLGRLETEAAAERVQRTFMFTDIERSTNLVEAIGDEAWENLVGWHDRTLRSLFEKHGGEEVDHTGDGFFVAFEDPRAALECSIAIQRSLEEHRRTHGFAPQVRIGVHASEATRRPGDYGGRGVHEAARIGAQAMGGEILASVSTVVSAADACEVSDPREVTLKGISTPVQVVSVAWKQAGGS